MKKKEGMLIANWDEFEREIGGVFGRYSGKPGYSCLLFRGQAKASWRLKTTLERYTDRPYKMREYWELIQDRVKYPVESVTERRWEIGEYPEKESQICEEPLGYAFMIYLRHHGFPSPLLDWTESPYVAAFFALRSAMGKGQEDPDGEAAIHCYQEYRGAGKERDEESPHIIALGPNVRTTPRHFRQQSWYTICRVLRDGHYAYANHEEVFQQGDSDQDVLTKYRIPLSQSRQFRDRLSLMNINAYTLFGNEEGLMETMAYNAIFTKSL